ncbi:hypothetical protein BGZ59_001376 [Podila verticillata]|nr:hypothetical protein BGZ59_001376 [Podila verticillata]
MARKSAPVAVVQSPRMTQPTLRPKDALVLCTVSLLFAYFTYIVCTNYALIVPFWTPLFWAAALSVPLHALKCTLLPPISRFLENDISSIVVLLIGNTFTFVLRFFLGSYVANGIRYLFSSYCHAMYLVCDGKSKETDATHPRGTCKIPNCNHYEQFLDYRVPDPSIEEFYYEITGDQFYELHPEFFDQPEDYQLHAGYQALVDQEPDNFARRSIGPSYINILRIAFIYVLSKLGTHQELFEIAKAAVTNIEIGTKEQLSAMMLIVVLHIIYTCLQYFVAQFEAVLYPKLTQDERRKHSIFNTLPRTITRAVQESLNSVLTTTIVLFTLAVIATLLSVLSLGIAHDIQGIMVQTHERVKSIKAPQTLIRDGSSLSKSPYVNSIDDGLVMAYDTGINWFDPILKDAFPTLSWGAADWAFHLSHVIVDHQEPIEPSDPICIVPRVCTQQILSSPPKYRRPANHNTTEESEHVDLWVFPSLNLLRNFFTDPESSTIQLRHQPPTRMAINLTLAKFLVGHILGYRGLDNSTMLWGFNVFNDLLFRWILFLLGLTAFTGLKVSPIQRSGWIIDQALASTESMGSFRLSTSASPGRVLAKNLEFAITGTFLAMFKLSIYHTIFTLTWTYFLAERVATDAGVSYLVPVKYAWVTSLCGIVLILFPIAPNWLVSLPGALIHFYVYGQRKVEAIAMAVGHFLFATVVDGAVWDTHVVKMASPGVSSAFWLGLWIFLGGTHWGIKGLLVGPVMFASIPAIWSAVLELRGRPDSPRTGMTSLAQDYESENGEVQEHVYPASKTNGYRNLSDSETASESENEANKVKSKYSAQIRRRIRRL